MEAWCVILARAGSKGVPGKNRALLAGRPCVAWTIDDARAADTLDRVAVSTDDVEVARAARGAGVEVVERPAHLATDAASVHDAARHAVEVMGSAGARTPDDVVILYACVPVRPARLIDRAVALRRASGCDSVQSYAPVGKFHPWWLAKVEPESGRVSPWEGDVLNHGVDRRQDLPPAFIPDGGVLVVRSASLALEVPGAPPGPHAFLGVHRRGIVNEPGTVIDIDSPQDLLLAEAALGERARATMVAHAHR
jgi:CMP-N,N'-diacetyllegionaminic acid synthase